MIILCYCQIVEFDLALIQRIVSKWTEFMFLKQCHLSSPLYLSFFISFLSRKQYQRESDAPCRTQMLPVCTSTLIVCLVYDATSSCATSNNRVMIDGWIQSWPSFRYYPRIGLKGSRKITNDLWTWCVSAKSGISQTRNCFYCSWYGYLVAGVFRKTLNDHT